MKQYHFRPEHGNPTNLNCDIQIVRYQHSALGDT